MNAEDTIVVQGNPDDTYACITADTRPYLWHAWQRAPSHILQMKNFNYFERVEAAETCKRVVEACTATMKPPKRDVPAFGWGKPIHPGDKKVRIKGVE